MPEAVRKAEACPPVPNPASQVAANPGTRVRCDPGGLKRRGGSDRHGQRKAEGADLGRTGAGRPVPSLKGSPTDRDRDKKKKEVLF